MKINVQLYVAMSVDGFIATQSGDSDWVSDSENFDSTLEQAGCYIVGGETYRQYSPDLFPIEGLQQVVITADSNLAETTSTSPQEALQLLEAKGYDKVVVVGGAQTWASFINASLANTLTVEIEPLMIGTGMTIAEITDFKKLKLTNFEPLPGGRVKCDYEI